MREKTRSPTAWRQAIGACRLRPILFNLLHRGRANNAGWLYFGGLRQCSPRREIGFCQRQELRSDFGIALNFESVSHTGLRDATWTGSEPRQGDVIRAGLEKRKSDRTNFIAGPIAYAFSRAVQGAPSIKLHHRGCVPETPTRRTSVTPAGCNGRAGQPSKRHLAPGFRPLCRPILGGPATHQPIGYPAVRMDQHRFR
jgi:hypothetical protein